MAIRSFKPTSAGRRHRAGLDFEEVTKSRPEPKLTEGRSEPAGRNTHGHVTARRRGGGHKRKYRIIDFCRDKLGVPALVASVEYDPNRSARIALLAYQDGEK